MIDALPDAPRKGRGAVGNPAGRFELEDRVAADDGWWRDPDAGRLETVLTKDSTRTIISRNDSPDIPFDRSINPYRGCEHGCVYCFARPTHSYLGLSPGLDFESRIFFKPDAARLLETELRKSGYQCKPIALGVNTDAYQPAERELGITRSILEVLSRYNHPVSLITKSAGILRDLDILSSMAERNLVHAFFSITTLDPKLARTMEPRAARPDKRLEAIRQLSAAGIPTGVMAAPMIPAINDQELEGILEAAAGVGATRAGYILLRLPWELKEVFSEWLGAHFPDRAQKVETLIRSCRQGKLNQAGFGRRMRGDGPYAALLNNRFKVTERRLGLDRTWHELDSSRFAPPPEPGVQLTLI